MDFGKAAAEKKLKQRNKLIENEIYDENWNEHIDIGYGWPDDGIVEDIEIEDYEDRIEVNFSVYYSINHDTGCDKKSSVSFENGTAYFLVTIDKTDGEFEIDNVTESVEESEAVRAVERGDYY